MVANLGDKGKEARRISDEIDFRNLIGSLVCEDQLLRVNAARPFFESSINQPLNPRIARVELDGYKLAMLVPVQSLLELAVGSPQIFGMNETEGVYMMYHWHEEDSPIPTGQTPHEGLVRSIWWVRTQLISARDWHSLEPASARVSKYLDTMLASIKTHYQVRDVRSSQVFRVSQIAPKFALDYLHLTFHDVSHPRIAHWELFRGGSTNNRRRTARHGRPNKDIEHETDAAFFRGYLTAVQWLWKSLVPTRRNKVEKARFDRLTTMPDWEVFDEFYGEVGHMVDNVLGPYGFKETIRHGLEVELTRPFSQAESAEFVITGATKVPPTNQFDRMFEMRPVRVGASHPYAQDNYFTALFTGLLFWARKSRDKVKVLRFRHPEAPGSRFSYALFVPAFGTGLSNASEYWLIVGVATDFSGNGNQSRLMIEGLIKGGGKDVVVCDYDVPDVRALENYVRTRALTHLRARARDFEALLGDFRGSVSELVVAELLRREGFKIHGVSQRLRALGGKEVDVIAVKMSSPLELLLIECKAFLGDPHEDYANEYPGPRHDLNRDLWDALVFVKTINHRLADCSSLFKELNIKESGKVVAVVAVVGTVDQRAKEMLERRGAVVWDWEDLNRRFVKRGISRRIWEPLERFALMDRRAESALELERDVLRDVDVSLNR